MLQAQINPHFLYNTLDAIMWQAEANNSDEVIHITRALSDFFRISLSSGQEWISVEQERRHLEGYLSIQKVRYRDILSYSIEIDPDMNGEMVPKLLLQPLAENAIYHGIKLKRGGGKITVTGRREGASLYFCVQDTGPGIPPDRLEEIRRAIRQEDVQISSIKGSGFGLKNVDLRIRLYYAQQEGLTIESGAGGTIVSFRVPAGMKGKNDV
jgi:two-component system sensor histidine kinase YesM